MNATAIRTAGGYLAAWGAIVCSVVLLSFLFTFLGTITCAVLIGMMMGAFKGAKWFSVSVSLVFPGVIFGMARGAKVVASSSQANHGYLREIGATPVLYGEGVVARVQAAAGGPVDAVFDVAGKTPAEDLVSLAPQPSQVVTIANFDAGLLGARVTGGGADSHPMQALALVADLLAQNKLVIKVQTFPFERAAEAYRISHGGHVRGKLVLVP